nr:hypothetical protein [Tanacetum cinerariifolium]
LSDGENATRCTWLLISLTRCTRSGVLYAILLQMASLTTLEAEMKTPINKEDEFSKLDYTGRRDYRGADLIE